MNGTIKVVCYRYKTLSNGESPLMIRICKDGKKKYQSLGISVKVEQWDFKTNLPKVKCPNRERIILLINEKINKIQKAALDKQIAGKEFTATTLIESTSSKNNLHKTVGEYYLTYIQNLKKEKRIRYAGMFEVSYNSFIKFNKHFDLFVALKRKHFQCVAKREPLRVAKGIQPHRQPRQHHFGQ